MLFDEEIDGERLCDKRVVKMLFREQVKGRSATTIQIFSLIREQMNGVTNKVANDCRAEAGLERIVLPLDQSEQCQIPNDETVAAT